MSTDHIEPAAVPGVESNDYDRDLDDVVEVRRDGPVSAIIGGLGAAVAVAYLLRAVGSGSTLDWVVFLITGLIGVAHLSAFVDSRAPLMVLDRHGVRVRRGREWRGVAWPEVERIEHRPRQSVLRDGELTVVAGESRLGVRLSLSTRLIGADWHELDEALTDLSGGRTEIVELRDRAAETPEPVEAVEAVESVEPEAESRKRPKRERPRRPQRSGRRGEPVVDAPQDTAVRPAIADSAAAETTAVRPTLPAEPAEPVAPARDLARGSRGEAVLAPRDIEPAGSSDPDATEVYLLPGASDRRAGEPGATETIVIDGAADASEAPPVPILGPQLLAARRRLGLSVDQLADRTRIRPHVIESIEVDDFTPCGGDFYARGHLRTLARILGLDAGPLVEAYDETYADAPIDPRRVFEAELATGAGGTIRGTRGRLNWSVLVAAVMAVVLLWSVARLVMDAPVTASEQPVLNGSPGGRAQLSGSAAKVPVKFTAATGGAHVIIRDGRQQVVFDEDLAFMQTATVDVVPPVRISSTDGGVTVSVDGKDKGALGGSGKDAQQTFVP
ncbi:helix-turn-helix domain-containing protein [Nocardioides sp. GXZ039]|uniref:helix-turn-helix domain-containing protein n=1 Tax=Nocardioides sp. GXZ039 TaxID=3136018 RepID=UPI0030F417FE